MRMAKRGWWMVGGAAALLGTALLPASAGPQVMVNGERVQGVRIYTIGGHTMVPIRKVIERMPGASVQFVRAPREIIVTDRGQRVVLHTGSGIARVGGRGVSLDAPVVMRNGTALMPARFVEEVLGAKVEYDRATQMVSITAGLNETRALGYRKVPWLKYTPKGSVAIGGEDVITFLHPGIYSSVRERARRITELLNDGLAEIAPQGGGSFDKSRVYLAQGQDNPVIMMGKVTVVQITPDDAEKHNTTQQALAEKWLERVQLALADVYGNAGANR